MEILKLVQKYMDIETPLKERKAILNSLKYMTENDRKAFNEMVEILLYTFQ